MKYVKECLSIFFHSIKVGYQLMTGFFRLARLQKPIITIFGGAKVSQDSNYVKLAHELAHRFAKHGVSIISGGGPGIMMAAHCGAASAHQIGKKARTLGVNVSGVDASFVNPCSDMLEVNYFFMRKWLLVRYSVGFIIFPGGVGTMDEFFDLLNLMKHHRIPDLPIVLIGIDYWKPLISWFRDSGIKSGLIDERLIRLFMVTDDIDEAYKQVYTFCEYYRAD